MEGASSEASRSSESVGCYLRVRDFSFAAAASWAAQRSNCLKVVPVPTILACLM